MTFLHVITAEKHKRDDRSAKDVNFTGEKN